MQNHSKSQLNFESRKIQSTKVLGIRHGRISTGWPDYFGYASAALCKDKG